jgi:TonB-dependent starch-binding outer membrane protein SusC
MKSSLRIFVLTFFIVIIGNFTSAQENDSKIVKPISGKITSETNEAIPGVTVLVEGTNIGVSSDNYGYYSVMVPESAKVLVLSSIGYVSQRVEIDARSSIDIVMKLDIVAFSELVVIGYGKVKKSDLTGSVSSISSKDYNQQPVTRVDQILQGRSSGIEVKNNTGAPGSDVKMRIRGANSILGNNNPLIVVDGISDFNLNDINTNDIDKIEILKDASSTAIYGSRGANGVILITTKNGKKTDKPIINFNTFFSVSELPKKIDYLNAYQFATLWNVYNQELYGSPSFTDLEVADFKANGGTDWQDEVFRKGGTSNYELSIQGGNEKSNYYLSGEYLDQSGILINTNFNKYSVKTKVETQVNDKIKLGINLSGVRRFAHNTNEVGNSQSTLGRLPSWVPTESIWEIDDKIYNNKPSLGASEGNPVALQLLNNSDWISTTLLTNGFVEYTPFKDLEIRAATMVELRNETNNVFNNLIPLDNPKSASASIYNSQRLRTESNVVATYTKELGIHNIQLTAIYEESSYKIEEGRANADSLMSTLYSYHNMGINGSSSVSSYYEDSYLRSFAGRINYVLLGRYLFTSTFRSDGSSKFGDNNKWANFPSLAVGWNLGEESFIKDLNVFHKLKLRTSWGISGSQAAPPYSTITKYNFDKDNYYAVNGYLNSYSIGAFLSQPGNKDLKWESTNQKDIGLEMSFFNDRLSFEGDYYYKKTNDLLLMYTWPLYAGTSNVVANIGSLENKGIDISVEGVPVNTSEFLWKVSFSFSRNRNKVLSLGEGIEQIPLGVSYLEGQTPYILQAGQPLGTFYGEKYKGVWKTTDTLPIGVNPGDAKTDSFQILGSAQPDFTFGFNSSLNYKNWELNIFISGLKGGKIYNMGRQNALGLNAQSRAFTSSEYFNRYSPENENTQVPAFTSAFDNSYITSRYLEDASFVRLKNLSIGYNVSESFLRKLKISVFQVYFSAQNLITLTKYKGYDPEASSARSSNNSSGKGSDTDTDQNIDAGAYPNPKSFSMGCKLTF